MKLTKKLNVAMVLVVVCLVLVIGSTYAWFAIALNPEVQRIETNVGANGSLEIALLTGETFEDPGRITTTVGDSAVKQDVIESNKSWGNVIQLSGGYGLEEIILLPARLNVKKNADGVHYVENGNGILKTAEFGLDESVFSVMIRYLLLGRAILIEVLLLIMWPVSVMVSGPLVPFPI